MEELLEITPPEYPEITSVKRLGEELIFLLEHLNSVKEKPSKKRRR